MAKKYRLTSASGDGPKICGFFFSDKGCRNGVSCKFSHEKPVAAVAATSPNGGNSGSSVVSSETESDGEIVENHAVIEASLEIRGCPTSHSGHPAPNCANPFLAAVGAPTSAPPATAVVAAPAKTVIPAAPAAKPAANEAQRHPVDHKKTKKRKPSQDAGGLVAPCENIFDLGKAISQTPTKKIKGAAAGDAAAYTSPNNMPKGQTSVAPPDNKEKQLPPQSTVTKTPKSESKSHSASSGRASVSFLDLQLPIASFSVPVPDSATPKPPSPRPPSPQHEPAPPPPVLPLPTATPAHLKWNDAVIATRASPKYANAFNYDRTKQSELEAGLSTAKDWITSRPYGDWCAGYPAAIAIDCEMCETRDPATGAIDPKALCRVSIVNADNPDQVLLDTLVKPAWPVSDYRTFVNGIAKKDLEGVEFTIKHAQTFMAALCSDQTVVVGHAVHNDLLALRMVHHCIVDTAMLFRHAEGDSSPSLKNLAHGVFKRDMPDVHCSVNDARVALACAEHWVENNGEVEPVEKVFTRSRSRSFSRSPHRPNDETELARADTTVLLVHRLPKGTMPGHISEMFLANTSIRPKHVPEIVFTSSTGRCQVEFASREHAQLAYMTLLGKEREDKKGLKQKRVDLKNGGYVCVRKMR